MTVGDPAAGAAPRVAVVGAGLSGLTSAYRLQQQGIEVTVFEAAPTTGGRAVTVAHAGYLADSGASAISANYAAYRGLAAEVGLTDAPAGTVIGIVKGDRINLFRMDRMMRSGALSGLLSISAKLRVLRLLRDVRAAKRQGHLDFRDMRRVAPLDTETAREYALRRLGPDLDAYLCEPIVRTMLIADTDEVNRVDLFAGIANMFGSPLMSLVGGQGMLPQALTERLDDVRPNRPVVRVQRVDAGVEVEHHGADGVRVVDLYDGCVVTVPHPVAAIICRGDEAALVETLAPGTDYTTCVSVAVGVTAPPRTPAMLLQFPSVEDPEIALIFLEHNKSGDRAPEGKGLLEVMWSHRGSVAAIDESDDAIVARTLATVFRVLPELRGRVDYTHVTRWRRALPRTRVGGYEAIGAFNARVDRGSPIQFAADYQSAPGQNTAVLFGQRAAKRLAASLSASAQVREPGLG